MRTERNFEQATGQNTSYLPVRVLFVVPDLRFGGAERHVATLLPNMNPAKFTASAICIGEEGELFAELVDAGVEAQALHLAGKRNALRSFRSLVSYMQKARPDVVVVRGYNAEILGRLAALVTRVKYSVVWVHNIGDSAPRSRLRGLADRVLLPSTSRYFGVAEAQRQHIMRGLHCPEDKIRIIHNGIDPALFSPNEEPADLSKWGIAADDPVVGIVAALRPEKDHATLLHAARKLLSELPQMKVLIVGDGPLRAELEELSAELGISHSVRFAGSRSDVSPILRAIDVFVLCSFTVECFPFSVLEAMSCARPVVCTEVGGVGEMVRHGVNGYLVPMRNPDALSNRLRELLLNPELAQRMGQAGRQRIEAEFTLERSVARTEEAIDELVGRAHSPEDA